MFKFSSDQAGATFQCKVDKKAFKACTSPFKAKVKNGAHTFTVRAVNAQGVADPTPVEYKWTVGAVKARAKR
jgi:large repetitive protein